MTTCNADVWLAMACGCGRLDFSVSKRLVPSHSLTVPDMVAADCYWTDHNCIKRLNRQSDRRWSVAWSTR